MEIMEKEFMHKARRSPITRRPRPSYPAVIRLVKRERPSHLRKSKVAGIKFWYAEVVVGDNVAQIADSQYKSKMELKNIIRQYLAVYEDK